MRQYEQIIEEIEHAPRFGEFPGIEITGRVLEKLGHPEKGIPFIHVAGTNGKGSTCAFLGNILSELGMKTGVFTSPHLIAFEERIVVNKKRIPREAVVRIGNQLLDTAFGTALTMFDYCLAMALLYFREQDCDCMVLETGLGGRMDSTAGVGIPKVSVITKIGFDHMAILGNTLSEIAEEKAGIFKRGTYVVLERQEAEAERVLLRRAQEAGAAAVCVVSESDIAYVRGIKLRMRGAYQLENAAAAVLAAQLFCQGQYHLERSSSSIGNLEECIKKGLSQTFWQGRMEILSRRPFLLADGAHNSSGVEALRESLTELYPDEKFHFVMGVMADKDYLEMIKELLPLAIDFVTVTPENERALQAEELAQQIRACGIQAKAASSIQAAMRNLDVERRTVAFGSLYFIGELKQTLHLT